MTNGQIAFEAYNKNRGGVNFQGNKTPDWFDLPPEIRTAWEVAAGAVIAAFKPSRLQDVHNCARCGADHTTLRFKRMNVPIFDDDNTMWAWWAICPLSGDPILLSEKLVEGEEKSE